MCHASQRALRVTWLCLKQMGITKGTPLHVRKVAPLGDPVEITVRGYELSVRKEDAAMVEIEDK